MSRMRAPRAGKTYRRSPIDVAEKHRADMIDIVQATVRRISRLEAAVIVDRLEAYARGGMG